jgi:hypothetical protein
LATSLPAAFPDQRPGQPSPQPRPPWRPPPAPAGREPRPRAPPAAAPRAPTPGDEDPLVGGQQRRLAGAQQRLALALPIGEQRSVPRQPLDGRLQRLPGGRRFPCARGTASPVVLGIACQQVARARIFGRQRVVPVEVAPDIASHRAKPLPRSSLHCRRWAARTARTSPSSCETAVMVPWGAGEVPQPFPLRWRPAAPWAWAGAARRRTGVGPAAEARLGPSEPPPGGRRPGASANAWGVRRWLAQASPSAAAVTSAADTSASRNPASAARRAPTGGAVSVSEARRCAAPRPQAAGRPRRPRPPARTAQRPRPAARTWRASPPAPRSSPAPTPAPLQHRHAVSRPGHERRGPLVAQLGRYPLR